MHHDAQRLLDFFKSASRRQAIHLRERGLCFYCLRRTSAGQRCVDHVVPRAKNGRNSYRNLVLAFMECNTLKGERSAADHLSQLYREGRLTDAQLTGRFRALGDLAAGKLRPQLPSPPGCKFSYKKPFCSDEPCRGSQTES